jgi:hypothetical protein
MASTDSSLSGNVSVLGVLNTSAFRLVIYHRYVTTVYLRSSIFCDIAWCRFVFGYRHFVTTCRSHLEGSGSPQSMDCLPSEDGTTTGVLISP